MKNRFFTLLFLLLLGGSFISAQTKGFYPSVQKKNISKVLDDLNLYASQADFQNYFNLFASESQFIGTESLEVWNLEEFKQYAKPYFDKGQGWTYRSLKREIEFSHDGKYAWFHEVLDSSYGLCRGSGVVERIGNQWKIRQYVLSFTVPNAVASEVARMKKEAEEAQKASLSTTP